MNIFIKRADMLIIGLLIISFCGIFEACSYKKVEWSFIDSLDNKMRITVDGNEYIECWDVEWMPEDRLDVTKIGNSIYWCNKDEDHIYVMLEEKGFESREIYFCREDFKFPPFSAEGVNIVGFKYPFNKSLSEDNVYYVETTDLGVIQELFSNMINSQSLDTDNYIEYRESGKLSGVGQIIFRNKDMTGVEIMKEVYAVGDKYMIIMDDYDHYIELPKNLLSKLADINMPDAVEFSQLDIEEIYDFYGEDFK